MKKVYLYPLTARNKSVVVNPYMGNLRDALNENFQVVNAKKPSTTGIFDILRYLGKVDVVYFNWSEELPSLHRGRIQGIFLLLLLQCLKHSSIKVIWTLHNKESHFEKNSFLKKKLFAQMLKRSDVIITHAKEGLGLIPDGKASFFTHHPVSNTYSLPEKRKEYFYEIIIWGNISPYKGISAFLKFLEERGLIRKYRILLAGKITTPELAKELEAYREKYDNLEIMDEFVETEKLIELIQSSRITLFTYHSESILSSGVLMDSLTYGATIVGPRVGAFKDLHELELIETYTDFNSLVGVVDPLLNSLEENHTRKLRMAEFMEANSWSQFSSTLLKLFGQ